MRSGDPCVELRADLYSSQRVVAEIDHAGVGVRLDAGLLVGRILGVEDQAIADVPHRVKPNGRVALGPVERASDDGRRARVALG